MKLAVFFVLFGAAQAIFSEPVNVECNIRHCGIELLNFSEFNFQIFIRKIKTAIFCLKNCSPPPLQEFFQSIIFAITKRIPGKCEANCVDHNRFVALAHCSQKNAWPLLSCGLKLMELAKLALQPEATKELHWNKSCSAIIQTTQCLEETLQRCGTKTFGLIREIFGDVVKNAIYAYCHPNYIKTGSHLSIEPNFFDQTTTEIPRLPPVAKALKRRRGRNNSPRVFSSIFWTLSASVVVLISYYRG